jgi:hypothetical protein
MFYGSPELVNALQESRIEQADRRRAARMVVVHRSGRRPRLPRLRLSIRRLLPGTASN